MFFFRARAADGELRCGRFIQEQGFLSGCSEIAVWAFSARQLHHLVHGQSPKIHPPSTLTQFEKLFMGKYLIPHSISVLYKLLQSNGPVEKPLYIRQWERDLKHNFLETQLDPYLLCKHKDAGEQL